MKTTREEKKERKKGQKKPFVFFLSSWLISEEIE
jgi:hypothetical protein